jgi:putative tryptophan/tyrosine transport system substrate-binding protein
MRRIGFAVVLALGALLAARATGAQSTRSDYRIGYLSVTSATNGLPNLEAFRAGLRALGYIEGQNVTIEARWADGHIEDLPRLAAELVRFPVDLLCTAGTQASGAAKQTTATIPIVFANVAFPVQTGLVASYPRPGGNITGIAFLDAEYGKRLELLKEIYPKLARVALIYNADNPASVAAFQETERWATALGISLEPHKFRRPSDFERVFSAIAAKRPDALMTTADALVVSYRTRLLDFTAKHRLLSMYPAREFVVQGGLMFYGSSIPAMFRQVAVYVDKILRGAKPADLPVEQATKFEFVLNVKAAKALGLTIPQTLLLRADQVIE